MAWQRNGGKRDESESKGGNKQKKSNSVKKESCIKIGRTKFVEGGGEMGKCEWRRVKVKIKTLSSSMSIYLGY